MTRASDRIRRALSADEILFRRFFLLLPCPFPPNFLKAKHLQTDFLYVTGEGLVNMEETGVHDPNPTLRAEAAVERASDHGLRSVTRPATVYSRPNGNVVAMANRPDPARVPGAVGRPDGNVQAGQSFADLLLVACVASRAPMSLLSVNRGGRWSTLSFGTDQRESLDDPELFRVIATRKEPVEVIEPGANPALANSQIARSPLGIRWLLGIPLVGASGEVEAVFAVLDVEQRELSRRERSSMLAIGRLLLTTLGSWRAPGTSVAQAVEPQPQASSRMGSEGHQLLRSHEVAELFDVTERTVINWAASGKLACLRTVGGHLRFRSDDVLALLEANSLRRRTP